MSISHRIPPEMACPAFLCTNRLIVGDVIEAVSGTPTPFDKLVKFLSESESISLNVARYEHDPDGSSSIGSYDSDVTSFTVATGLDPNSTPHPSQFTPNLSQVNPNSTPKSCHNLTRTLPQNSRQFVFAILFF